MTKKQHESLQIKRAEEKRLQKIEEEKRIVSELTEKKKYSWRSELNIDNITTGTHQLTKLYKSYILGVS